MSFTDSINGSSATGRSFLGRPEQDRLTTSVCCFCFFFTFKLGFNFWFDGTLRIVSRRILFLVLFTGRISRMAPLQQLEEFALLAGHDRFSQLGILFAHRAIRLAFLFLYRGCLVGRYGWSHRCRSGRQSGSVRSRNPRQFHLNTLQKK